MQAARVGGHPITVIWLKACVSGNNIHIISGNVYALISGNES